MKIRITRDTKIPLVEKGRVFYVQGVSTTGDGETVYFIHHGGNYLGIWRRGLRSDREGTGMKNVAREATNGVIYGESGEIVKNGLRVVCPHCGEIGLYPGHGGSVNIWTVGAIERRECTKCRKQFHAISLTVPADMTPEEFYLKIKEGVKL